VSTYASELFPLKEAARLHSCRLGGLEAWILDVSRLGAWRLDAWILENWSLVGLLADWQAWIGLAASGC